MITHAQKVDTSNVKEIYTLLENQPLIQREDAAEPALLQEHVLMNAPDLMRPRITFSLNTGTSGRFA